MHIYTQGALFDLEYYVGLVLFDLLVRWEAVGQRCGVVPVRRFVKFIRLLYSIFLILLIPLLQYLFYIHLPRGIMPSICIPNATDESFVCNPLVAECHAFNLYRHNPNL